MCDRRCWHCRTRGCCPWVGSGGRQWSSTHNSTHTAPTQPGKPGTQWLALFLPRPQILPYMAAVPMRFSVCTDACGMVLLGVDIMFAGQSRRGSPSPFFCVEILQQRTFY